MLALGESKSMTGLHGAEYYDVQSGGIGENYRVFVASPIMALPDKQYPVVYTFDGNLMFAFQMQMFRMMQLTGELPPVYLVSIGYSAEDFFATDIIKRYRDFSPTQGGELEKAMQTAADPGLLVTPGGAEHFQSFLIDELRPAIEKAYPINSSDSTIAGSSIAGLFCLWTLLTRPEAFQKYIPVSPSSWWDGEAIWQWEESYAQQNADLKAKIFLCAGQLETADHVSEVVNAMANAGDESASLRAEPLIRAFSKYGTPKLAELIDPLCEKLKSRDYRGLEIHSHIFEDETHQSVAGAAYSRGLRYVFDTWRPS